jgi:hypothetical protein
MNFLPISKSLLLLALVVVLTVQARLTLAGSLFDSGNWQPIASTAPATTLKCRYIFINKSIQQSVIGLYSRIFQSSSGSKPELNHVYFKYYADDCLNSEHIINEIEKVGEDFVLFGLDLSSNQLNDTLLEHVLNKNPVLRYNINLIKYLNLSDNNLSKLNSAGKSVMQRNQQPNELDEELNYLNEYYLKPDEEFYLLNRFFNLEVLILDRNPELAFNMRNVLQIFQKLRVLSLNKCQLGDRSASQIGSVNHRQLDLFYLGLSANKLDENKLRAYFEATDNQTLTVDILDLSNNKFTVCEEIFRPGKTRRVNKLDLEHNLVKDFNINTLKNMIGFISEINLRFNFIKNTNIDNFKLASSQSNSKISIKLEGNPLVCDCDSQWLMDLADLLAFNSQQNKPLADVASSSQSTIIHNKQAQTFLSRKKASKNLALLDSSSIKLVYRRNINYDSQSVNDKSSNYEIKAEEIVDNENVEFVDQFRPKREIEEISPHFSLDNDPNLSAPYYMPPRQKRVRFGQSPPSYPSLIGVAVNIIDMDTLTCSFIDTQNFDWTKKQVNESVDATNSDYDLMESVDYSIISETRQNVNANSVRYVTRLIGEANATDFVCAYADHCKPSECDCCVFQHCHCRSICPAECKCYYDAGKMQNIIDCSMRGLGEMPSTENPIESATDIRLNGNGLATVKPHTFFGFGSVKFLYLQENKIVSLGKEAFEDLKYTLKLLNLANNNLEFVDFGEFSNFSDLEVIVLSRNPLKHIDQYLSVLNPNSLPSFKVNCT